MGFSGDVSDVERDAADLVRFVGHVGGVLRVPHAVPHAVHILDVKVVGPLDTVTTEAMSPYNIRENEEQTCDWTEHVRTRAQGVHKHYVLLRPTGSM